MMNDKLKKFDEVVDGAVQETLVNGTLSKVLRYIILFGWIAAGAMFYILAGQILDGQTEMGKHITQLCSEISSIKEWKDNMNNAHRRIDKRLDDLFDRVHGGRHEP